ncbi:hypothetical protein ACI3LY_002806 [Candidozyma auris]
MVANEVVASGWIVVSLQPEAKERERRKNEIKQKNEEKKRGEAKLPMARMEDVLEKLLEITSESPFDFTREHLGAYSETPFDCYGHESDSYNLSGWADN